jgi:hypothetical protein
VKWLFEFLVGEGRPVRRDANLRATTDAEGNPSLETAQLEVFSLSDDGSIDRGTVVIDQFYACGCSVATARLAGHCALCARTACQRCLTRCVGCRRALCVLHTTTIVDERVTHWCPACATAQRCTMILRAFLPPPRKDDR